MKVMNPDDVIESLKQALSFYANEINYDKNLFHEKGLIYSDKGSQARFALSLIEDYEKSEFNDDIEVDQQDELDLFDRMLNNLKNNG